MEALGTAFAILLLGSFSESRPEAKIDGLKPSPHGPENNNADRSEAKLFQHDDINEYARGTASAATGPVDLHSSGIDVGNEAGTYIIGGGEATPGRWPWQAMLRLYGNFICGAVLIGRRHAITAAHCLQNAPYGTALLVDFGVHNRSQEPLDSVTVDEFYLEPGEDDIAVLRLSREVSLTPKIQPVQLAPSDDHAYDEDECWATGWGMVGYNELPGVLQEVPMDVLTYERCRQEFGASIEETFVCALGYEDRDRAICMGDSGGPLSCLRDGEWRVVGVSSWTFGFCATDLSSVFVRVSSFTDWIEGIMAQH